jgi:signal peptide peptidase SppA
MPPTIDQRTSLWGIAHDALPVIARFGRGKVTEAEVRAELEADATERIAGTTQGQVAVIPLQGVITPYGTLFSILRGGGGGLQAFRASLAEAVADDDISTILIAINSPGGRVDLVPEAAADVRAAGAKKKVVAVASTLAASAAYWIGSQAQEFIVSPSGDVGSIGVFLVHEDWSGFDEQMGIKTTLVSAGKYKTAGNMFEPLSEEARKVLQEGVDEVYDQFVADVATGRHASEEAVRNGFGEGACVGSQRAVDLGLADGIATFEETASRLVQEARGGRRAEAEPHEDLAGNDGEDKTLLAQMREQLDQVTESLKGD